MPPNPLRAEGVFWLHRVILLSRLVLGSHLRSPVYTPTTNSSVSSLLTFTSFTQNKYLYVTLAGSPTMALSGCSLWSTSIRQNTWRQRTHRRSLLLASHMTGFVVVDGAMLSTTGILVILILFTSCFPAYAFIFRYSAWLVQTTSMLAFSAAPTSLRRYFRSAPALFYRRSPAGTVYRVFGLKHGSGEFCRVDVRRRQA
jgi:hypothetical protein